MIGRERYKITAVLLPLFLHNGQCHLLFNVRSKNIPQPGEVCFPGGKFDSKIDADTRETALRETIEELGIGKEKIRFLGKLGYYTAPMGILVEAYVAALMISSLAELKYNQEEVEEVFALPVSELKKQIPEQYYVSIHVDPWRQNKNGSREMLLPYKKLGIPKRYNKPWGNIKHRIFVYQNDPVIWGITAELVYDFLKII
ncbi:MAG: CoA pyrophosphatase [Candidatus Marinimicrobia bacterium]|nr:CoA pyrophosphatase [Candidatus Neomarinimicrobiota bacterium]